MSSPQATVSAITLSQTDLDKIEVLDRSKNNWGVCPEENEFLHGHTNTYLTWGALKSRHEKVGPIAQILLIQQALAVWYRRSERLFTTSTQLNELVRRIYAIGIPKEEDFLTIMMLNAMAEDLPHVHNHIADALATSTSTTPYGPSNIHSRLDIEQQLIDTKRSKDGDIAMAAIGRGNHNAQSRERTACGNTSHPTKDCFGKGGATEGKRDEVLACKCAAREVKGSSTGRTPTSKPAQDPPSDLCRVSRPCGTSCFLN
ncbi:hypothetical protein BDR07DRAFT_1377336 [Suillus spraguei]|nr:hypothetical protein BDR07DRAFT_1377336 [Suillus spraguei]